VVFVPARAAQALDAKRQDFRQASEDSAELLAHYQRALRELSAVSRPEIEDRLGGVPWPGARPTGDLDEHGLLERFAPTWDSAQDARAWAMNCLRGVPTVAVDGSQVPPSKEFGVPVSLVQVAWFENYHDPDRPYIKDIRDEIVVPGNEEFEYASLAESLVSRRRFALEMTAAVERIESLSEKRQGRVPVLFIDGTFVLSFAGRMAPEVRQVYLQALFRLLDASERYRVPAIGYVDLSFASDLAGLLQHAFDLPSGNVFDAQILADVLHPFDRTAAFRTARGDVLPYYQTEERDRSGDLGFVYLQTGQDRLPARIDFPLWVLEAGLLGHVLDVVRAEVVVGSGYPYPIETADATAVLTTEDRLAFYALFHDFAVESGLTASMPAKSISKAHRR
jgi:hypothetical protein